MKNKRSEEEMLEIATSREVLRTWMHDNGFASAWAGGLEAIQELEFELDDEKAEVLGAMRLRYERALRGRLSS